MAGQTSTQPLNQSNTGFTPANTWTLAFVTVLLSHFTVDTFSQMIPASLGLIQEKWHLSDRQSAWFLGVGSLCSGLAQPIFAWLSDRRGNRIFGGLGLAIVALLISSLGLAVSISYLFAFYIVGMIGNGMFHPIAASTIGQLRPQRRSFAVSCFFVAGMLGGICGATLGPRLLGTPHGFQWLRLLAIPGLVLAFTLHRQIRNVEHRQLTPSFEVTKNGTSAGLIPMLLLYLSAASRFVVNMALVYLYVRWSEATLFANQPDLTPSEVARLSAPMVGNMNGASITGMAIGGFFSGVLIPAGREKTPYICIPLVCAPLVAMIPHANTTILYLLVMGAGIGFASLVPVTIALAQRLMPGRTSLASGLMLGGAWSMATFGPILAEYLIEVQSIQAAFYTFACVMAISGLIILPIPKTLIAESVERTVDSNEKPIDG